MGPRHRVDFGSRHASAVTHNVPYGVGGSARAVPLKDGRRYVWRVRVTTTGGVSVTSPLASFTMGLGLNPSKKRGATGPAGWTGQFIGMAKSANESAVAPWFRKTFFLAESDEGASSALLFVASVGFCEVTVNGKPASEAVLSPQFPPPFALPHLLCWSSASPRGKQHNRTLGQRWLG